MACNENIIKNIANEVTRNCQSYNLIVEPKFVAFYVDLLLLNPKYAKLFEKTLNRTNLEYFVNECVTILRGGDPSLNTLKMQFVMISNYSTMGTIVDEHVKHVKTCLKPLLDEILAADPDDDDDAGFKKLYRKICIYILLSSGLGNPSVVANLKEGMAALESVYSLHELSLWLTTSRYEKTKKVQQLLKIVSGVRLFNRDCKKGGEMIPNLPMDLMDSAKACMSLLSNSLIGVMQRVNMLTTAIEGRISNDHETGNVIVLVPPGMGLSEVHFRQMFELLLFNRQYETFIRRLLTDVERTIQNIKVLVSSYEDVLANLHSAVKFKNAVPCDIVFPMFVKLWEVWESMQNTMYLVSTINRLTTILGSIQDHMKIPFNILEIMLEGKQIVTDEQRMSLTEYSTEYVEDERFGSFDIPVSSIQNLRHAGSLLTIKVDKQVQFLGFCAMCLCQGAFIASNLRLGQIKYKGRRYGFCTSKMALRFATDPQRYINTLLDYARNNPQIITMLKIKKDVEAVKFVDPLIIKEEPKIKVFDKNVQTETHPIENSIVKEYTWNLWEYKKRATKMATVVTYKTHSTQTNYSTCRADIQIQTQDLRDKAHQTKKDVGMMTTMCNYYMWGLRGQKGVGHHFIDHRLSHAKEKMKPKVQIERCKWPCVGDFEPLTAKVSPVPSSDHQFYVPQNTEMVNNYDEEDDEDDNDDNDDSDKYDYVERENYDVDYAEKNGFGEATNNGYKGDNDRL